MIEIEKALELIATTVRANGSESVPLENAVGRVLTEAVNADVDSPPHTKSMMDGFAVRAADIQPGAVLSVVETIVAGDVPTQSLSSGKCSRIMTGAPLPNGADAVIMIEQATFNDNESDERVSFSIDRVEPSKYVVEKAASFGRGEQIFAPGHRVRPLDIGLLAEVGAHEVTAARQVHAAVLPTGNELVLANQKPHAGQIRNSNGPMLVAMLQNQNVVTQDLGIGRDDPQDLRAKIALGLESDLLVLSGGVSAGTMDLVPSLLQASGVVEVFHKVRVKPGKPIWFGVLRRENDRSTYVFGLPGNPVSSLVGLQLFVRSAIARMNGYQDLQPTLTLAELDTGHVARGDRPTYWPAMWLDNDSASRRIRPLKWLGSSDLRALGHADALIYFPSSKNEFLSGESVQVLSLA